MGSGSSRRIQNALILNLIIFMTGVVAHKIILADFSYLSILGNLIDTSMLAGIQGYFALGNSSAIITGTLLVFAYAAIYSLKQFGVNRRQDELQQVLVCKA